MNLQNCKFSFLNLICSVLECKQNDKVFDLSKKHYEIKYICYRSQVLTN